MLSILLFAQQKWLYQKILARSRNNRPANHGGAMTQLADKAVFKNNCTVSLSYYNFGIDPKSLPYTKRMEEHFLSLGSMF